MCHWIEDHRVPPNPLVVPPGDLQQKVNPAYCLHPPGTDVQCSVVSWSPYSEILHKLAATASSTSAAPNQLPAGHRNGLILTCMNQQGILDAMEKKMHPRHMAAACCVFADEYKAVPNSLSYWKFAVFGVTQNHAVCCASFQDSPPPPSPPLAPVPCTDVSSCSNGRLLCRGGSSSGTVIYTSYLSHALDNIFLDKQSPWTKGLTVIIECGRNLKLVNAMEFDQKDVKQGVSC
ncbi:hypothetical protein Anapl_10825 [Anas platyrhynchos]|uniref:Uncharacterized protein n=1 Tax=Anas platyrhynchos TaxID=8839 RepID=R0L8S6_ANAPL|nr:hypothetical protein Anapl_10825 [Anas platyrhynchos]